MDQQSTSQPKRLIHSRTNSYNNIQYHESTSSRNSMNLIEGTTLHFPQGNNKKPNSASMVDARLQRQRWDAFFEPQYSFNAFNYEDKQSATQDDELHKKKMDKLIDEGNIMLEVFKTPRSSSRHSYENSPSHFSASSTPTAGIMTPTLPCLNIDKTKSDKQIRRLEDEAMLMSRLELLKKIRMQSDSQRQCGQTDTDDIPEEPRTNTTQTTPIAANWKQLTEKAKRLHKEAQADAKSVVTSRSSTSSLELDEKQADIANEKESSKGCLPYRQSFLCFIFGFLFPPLWLVGAFYVSPYAKRQPSADRRMDRIWRRRSRIALCIFSVVLLILLVVFFVVRPDLVGWRRSKQPI
ncbi:hypothetical protein A0J61_08282 [Choanephora cucurbitarum]|uniref:Uncharacterized protein n=1 Tax=Choanephora cucurbitarum TaxID=101091 RepID=A0A1C7N4W1_9FUNG|nr:hypothetical protein A0J61_08282 [Choanephora cucurbitarum]